MRAIGHKLILKADTEESLSQSEGGIILAKTAVKLQTSGIVIAVGELVSKEVREGSLVEYFPQAALYFKHEEQKYITITDDDILAIIGDK